jgi:hypothetical protein
MRDTWTKALAPPLAVGMTACSFLDGSTATGGERVDDEHLAALPRVPALGAFQWQGEQQAFVSRAGQPCTGKIAIAVSEDALCYAAPGGVLRCAGSIHATHYGPDFADAGVDDVEQIFLSPSLGDLSHNAICVRRGAGEVLCMGHFNHSGQLGNGQTYPLPTFQRWGGLTQVRKLATATWDQFCALSRGGEVHCAGYGFGPVVTPQAASATTISFAPTGELIVDEPGLLRVSGIGWGRDKVTPAGFACYSPADDVTLGTAGDVVDGNVAMGGPVGVGTSYDYGYAWLDGAGRVTWTSYTPTASTPYDGPDAWSPDQPIFTQGAVLALAGNLYTTSLCVVYADGSIACRGDNTGGKLGVAAPAFLAQETIVAPPGSIDVSCTP